MRIEIAEFELPEDLIDKNAAAAREAYARTPRIPLCTRREPLRGPDVLAVPPPYLLSPQFTSPTIRRRGSAALRKTGDWRMERPEIDLSQCKRCFLCYTYSPRRRHPSRLGQLSPYRLRSLQRLPDLLRGMSYRRHHPENGAVR